MRLSCNRKLEIISMYLSWPSNSTCGTFSVWFDSKHCHTNIYIFLKPLHCLLDIATHHANDILLLLLPQLTIAVDFRVKSSTRFVENTYNIYISK